MRSEMNTASLSPTSAAAATVNSTRNLLDPDAFLTLLLAELQTQDPLDPMDTQAMVSQLSNMQMVADSRALRQNQEFAQATNLLGRVVTWKDASSGLIASGQVTGVVRQDAGTQLTIGNTRIGFDSVLTVS